MTFSKLTGRTFSTRKQSSRYGTPIVRLIVHHTAGGSDALAIHMLTVGEKDVSANYTLLQTAELVGIVPEEYRAWTSGSPAADNPSITIEVVNTTGTPTYLVSDAQLEKLAQLAADLCIRYNWGHLDRNRVIGHREVKATACPGPYLYPKLDWIVARANQILVEQLKPPTPKPEPIPVYPGVPDMPFYPVHPSRNSDTRKFGGPIKANTKHEFGLNDKLFPKNTSAVMMNITATGGAPGAFLTVWGSGPKPDTSVLNFNAGDGTANGFYGGPVKDLKFCVQGSSDMQIICDVTAYWTP